VDIDLVDECYVRAAPAVVAASFHDPANWTRWWPDLELSVYQDRGQEGVRWAAKGALTGSVEVWLEPFGEGVIVHHYLRATADGRESARRQNRIRTRRALAWKQHMWQLKDALEAARVDLAS
jgi:hypothetical protein